MALKIRGNTQILDQSIENGQLKDADVSLAKLSGAGSVSLADGASISLLSGASIDVSAAGASLTLADDQISGDKIEGGTIGSITISSADIDGGTIDGSTIAESDVTISATKSLVASAGSTVDLSAAGAALTLADDQISANKIHGGDISGDLVLSGGIVSVSNKLNVKNGGLIVDSAGDVSMSGKLTVMSDLEVRGTLTSINTTDLDIVDKLVTLGKGAADSAAADASGIHIDGANKSLKWSHADSKFVMDADLKTNLEGNVTGQVSDISNHDTDALAEGATNKYYSEALFDASLATKDTSDVAEDAAATTESGTMYYKDSRARAAVDAVNADPANTNGSLSYNSSTGEFTLVAITDAQIHGKFSAPDSSNHGTLSYDGQGKYSYVGTTDATYRAAFSADNTAGKDGSLAYADGVYTYTGPDASNYRAAVSATDLGGDGSFSYDEASGAFSYQGPVAADAHAHFSAGSGLSYSAGEYSISADGVSFAMLGCEMIDASMTTAANDTVPSSLAIKTYVDNQLASQSSADFAGNALEFKMSFVDSGQMINVKEIIEQHANLASGDDFIALNEALSAQDQQMASLSLVFLNGQKLRYDVDYKFADAAGNPSPSATHIHFINGVNLEIEDDVEVRRLKSA